MTILETKRLIIRQANLNDDAFFLELMNTPSWIQFIGDRGIHNLNDARMYISEKLIDSYQSNGFGLYVAVLRSDHQSIGLCGLIKRDILEDVDIGFAFLPDYTGKGYAYEAAYAVMNYAKTKLNIPRIVAITSIDNVRSGNLLEKLGLRFDKLIRFTPDDTPSKLYIPS